jgi:hypothetical protein
MRIVRPAGAAHRGSSARRATAPDNEHDFQAVMPVSLHQFPDR